MVSGKKVQVSQKNYEFLHRPDGKILSIFAKKFIFLDREVSIKYWIPKNHKNQDICIGKNLQFFLLKTSKKVKVFTITNMIKK